MIIDLRAKNIADAVNKELKKLASSYNYYHNRNLNTYQKEEQVIRDALNGDASISFSDDIIFHASNGKMKYKETYITNKVIVSSKRGTIDFFITGAGIKQDNYYSIKLISDFFSHVFSKEIIDHIENKVEPVYIEYYKRNKPGKPRKPPSETAMKRRAIKKLTTFLAEKEVSLSANELQTLFDLAMNRHKDLEVFTKWLKRNGTLREFLDDDCLEKVAQGLNIVDILE